MNFTNNDLSEIDRIEDVEQLEEMLSRPTEGVIETMRRVEGDIVVLGVGGKIGPSLARMARRASDEAGVARRIFGADAPGELGVAGCEGGDGACVPVGAWGEQSCEDVEGRAGVLRDGYCHGDGVAGS